MAMTDAWQVATDELGSQISAPFKLGDDSGPFASWALIGGLWKPIGTVALPLDSPDRERLPERRRVLGTRTPCWPTRTTDVTGITSSQHAATGGGWATGSIALTGAPTSLGRRKESVPDRRLGGVIGLLAARYRCRPARRW